MGVLCPGSCFVMQPASMPNQNYCKTRKDTKFNHCKCSLVVPHSALDLDAV